MKKTKQNNSVFSHHEGQFYFLFFLLLLFSIIYINSVEFSHTNKKPEKKKVNKVRLMGILANYLFLSND